jgi:hypothetical protein
LTQAKHVLLEDEIVLVMKKVTLKCSEGSVGEYLVLGTSVIDSESCEDAQYVARILIFE